MRLNFLPEAEFLGGSGWKMFHRVDNTASGGGKGGGIASPVSVHPSPVSVHPSPARTTSPSAAVRKSKVLIIFDGYNTCIWMCS